jgi:sugar phosphate isomerase/epimerase
MPPQISVQLYSVREQAAKNYEATIRAIAAMGFRNVEPAGFPGSSPAKAAALFKELGLKAPSCHGALPIGENKNAVLEDALMLGYKYIVTGCPPKFREHYASRDAVKAMSALYCEAADLFWVTKAGLNPADFVREIGPRGKLLHFKDGIVRAGDTFTEAETEDGKIMISHSTPFLPAGAGEVDLIGAAKASACCEYAVVELDSYAGDMMNAVRQSYSYLTKKGIARGGI